MRTTLGARVACRYAEQFEWSIETLSGVACSCDLPQCLTPGCHPVAEDWVGEDSKDPNVLTRLWSGREWWPIALTGLDFDAVIVAGPLTRTAFSCLERKGGSGLVLTWRHHRHGFLVRPVAVDGELRMGVSLPSVGGWFPLPAAALLSPAMGLHTDLNQARVMLTTLRQCS
jgi:hypothetical protein